MKVFLVNLDQDARRLMSANEQLKHLDIQYERIPGVYGKKLSAEERRVAFSPFRWWCAMGRVVAPAEIGCALSHYNIYRRMIADEGLDYCCILEDDVEFSPQFQTTLQKVEKWIEPSKPQVAILNEHQRRYARLLPSIHHSRFGVRIQMDMF